MGKTVADLIDNLIEAVQQEALSRGIVSPAKAKELEELVQSIKTEINDTIVTKSWVYDFLTNSTDDRGRGAGQ